MVGQVITEVAQQLQVPVDDIGGEPKRGRDGTLALSIIGVLLVGWCTLEAMTSPALDGKIVWGGLAVGLTAWCLLLHLIRAGRTWGLADFRLGSWLLLYGGVAFGFATISLIGYQTSDAALVNKSLAPFALSLAGAGYIMFFLGYRFGPKRGLSDGAQRLLTLGPFKDRSKIKPAPTLVLIYVVGLAATLAKVALEGGYGYIGGTDISTSSTVPVFDQPLTVLTFLRTAALFGFAARSAQTHRRSDKFLTLALFIGEVAFGLISGVKESFVIAILAWLIPSVLLGSRRRLPWVKLIAGVAAFTFIVTPFVTSLRDTVRSDGQRLGASASIAIAWDRLTSGGATQSSPASSSDNLQQVLSRVRMLDNVIIIVDKTPDVYPYRPLSELILAPASGLIPRFLWPNKPLRLSGLDFYKTYYEGQGVSSSAITYQGSLYMHGGSLIFFAGMLFYGWFLRGLDDGASRLGSVRRGLVSLVAFVPIVKQEMDAPTLFATMPILLVTYWLAAMAVLRPARVGESA